MNLTSCIDLTLRLYETVIGDYGQRVEQTLTAVSSYHIKWVLRLG